MKKFFILATLSLGMLTSSVMANTKVAYIDMLQAVEGFHKTKKVRDQLKENEESFKKELEGRTQGLVKLQGEINAIEGDLKKPELSDQAKQKRANEGREKIEEFQKLRQQVEEFGNQRRQQLQEQLNRMMKGIYDDIQKVVNERAKADGLDLVIDKSAAGRVGFPIVIHSNPAGDITESILSELNKNAPKENVEKKEEAKK